MFNINKELILFIFMNFKRIILLNNNYGIPTTECPQKDIIKVNFKKKYFEWQGCTFLFYGIKKVKLNLYQLKNKFGENNFCFRPKWYQLPKVLIYYYSKKKNKKI